MRNCQRDGLTLIEVVVGLLLLSTLLAGLLLSHRRHARQVRLARQKLVAVQVADRLLADWFAAPERFPWEATGSIPGNDTLTWETSVIDTSLAEPLSVQLVRLVIRNREPASAAEPLVDVELMVPLPIGDARAQSG